MPVSDGTDCSPPHSPHPVQIVLFLQWVSFPPQGSPGPAPPWGQARRKVFLTFHSSSPGQLLLLLLTLQLPPCTSQFCRRAAHPALPSAL